MTEDERGQLEAVLGHRFEHAERLERALTHRSHRQSLASVDNERNALALVMSGDHPYAGQKIGVVQIAGLIARRIICTAKAGDKLKAGERFGLIRFGSRTDVYLPQGLAPLVCIGQRVLGGETILADGTSQEKQREGEVR